jgi:hypothetical protein
MIHFRVLEKQEHVNARISTSKEIIKIKADINEMETKKKKTPRINETLHWFLKR